MFYSSLTDRKTYHDLYLKRFVNEKMPMALKNVEMIA